MERGTNARAAVAGPVALLAAIFCMTVAAALSNAAQWPTYAVVAVLPAALCVWLCEDVRPPVVALLAVATSAVSLGVAAAVVLLLVPLFEVAGVGISGAGVYTLLWGPTIVVLLGSIVTRVRSGASLLGPWLLWWVAVLAGILWAEPLTYAMTDLAGADAVAGTVAVLASPTLGMSAWVALVGVLLTHSRFRTGHLTSAST